MFNDKVTDIWSKYENIKDQHHTINLNNKSEKCHNFFDGKQWRGIAHIKEDELPFLNIVQPTVEYKVAMIAQQEMTMTFSPMNNTAEIEYQKVCDALNEFAKQKWELKKMDVKCWEVVKNACITGDSYIYFYDGDLNAQIIDNINVFLSDEQEHDIQKQKFIIIYERRNVSDVIADAKANGIKEKDIKNIVSDEDTDNLTTDAKNEVKNNTDGKCSCLLMLKKDENGVVTVSRSTKLVEYQKETKIFSESEDKQNSVALKIYPIAPFVWQKKKGSSRGIGEVEQLIPNQVSINKNLANRELAIKQVAYPKPVINESKILNPEMIDTIGATIKITDSSVQNIDNYIKYLNPQNISPDAKEFCDELIRMTRELAGAGDSALGNVDPTKASGTAIIAVQDQSAIPLNEQKATFKQFIEDIALIWYQLWITYNPQGIEVSITETDQFTQEEIETTITIPTNVLQEMKVNIKIDVSPNSPFSKMAQQQSLDNLFSSGKIEFEEYIEALDDNSSVPKVKLQRIIDKRKAKAEELARQQDQMIPQMPMQQMQGGIPNAMQIM